MTINAKDITNLYDREWAAQDTYMWPVSQGAVDVLLAFEKGWTEGQQALGRMALQAFDEYTAHCDLDDFELCCKMREALKKEYRL